MAEKKEKRYVSDNAQLMAEWNWEKNKEIDSSQLTLGSKRKVWWTCSQGHYWQATISSRNRGCGCPYCSGRLAIEGVNDLKTINPTLAKDWNYEKNNGLTPAVVMPNSGKRVWWKCNKGHEWQTRVADRNSGYGCPYCSGQEVLKGYNDLQTVNPALAKIWNYEKNGNLKPEGFTANSHKKVWWKCNKGHEWQAEIKSGNNGIGCPYCSGRLAIKGQSDLQTVNPILAKEWNYEKNNELTPADVMPNSRKKVWWKCTKGHEWQASIDSRSRGNGCSICSSERNTSFPEYALVYYLEKYGLKTVHSYKEKGYEVDVYLPSKKIAIEYDGYYWHKDKRNKDLEKNIKCEEDGIKLYRIREGLLPLNDSSIDYVIQKDHKDLSQILQKLLTEIIGFNVDIDVKRDAIAIENLREHKEKENSISFSNPKIANEWNYEKNGKIKPEYFSAYSKRKVWWKCSKGHEWQESIDNRNRGCGCPYCSGRKVLKGYNDLQTMNPVLARDWNYEKNSGLKPENYTANCKKKVWWKCNIGHEWQATIANRNYGCGCPYCAGKKVLKGQNDLHTLNPDLAEEWDYEKNGNLTPEDVTTHSSKNVWWICAKGHEWQSIIENRTKGNGCPYCSGRKVLKGYNDLLTVNPSLAQEWNYEKNGDSTPEDVTAHSNRKVWWICNNGHEWQAKINHRSNGSNCPECAKTNRKNQH